VKQPERYEPTEEVEDDYSDHEDIPDSDVSSEISYSSSEEDDSEEGSLKDFVVDSDQEDGGSTTDSGSSGEGSITESLHDDATSATR